MKRGYIQVYTGDGKGKTTAAIGLAIRAVGAGLKVWLLQFMKSEYYSEQKILDGISPLLYRESLGKPYFIAPEGTLTEETKKALTDVVVFPPGNPPAEYVEACRSGVEIAARTLAKGEYDVVILDEINVALHFGLVTRDDCEALIAAKPAGTELIFTGRKAPQWLVDRADLVTEMRNVKHYYDAGVANRRGIED